MLLPLTCQDSLIRELSPRDRLQYSKANKEACSHVESFNRRAFQVEKVLSPYFSPEEIVEFRKLQYSTGALISGSTALQFFDCSVYPDSDLDLYVELDWCQSIADFLQRIAYTYRPTKKQPPSFDSVLEYTLGLDFEHAWDDIDNNQEGFEGYIYNGIAGVFDFVRDHKKVQIIACHSCVMDVILGFHSTCVMNVISYTHAYALYPYATFIDRVSWNIVKHRGADSYHSPARQKYRDRGWTMVDWPSALAVTRPCSEFRFRSGRCVGDLSCWVIPLSPVANLPIDDLVRNNTWSNNFDPFHPRIMNHTRGSDKLKYRYSIDEPYVERFFKVVDDYTVPIGNHGDMLDRILSRYIPSAINQQNIIEKLQPLLANAFGQQMPEQQGAAIPNACVAIVLTDLLEELSENATYHFEFKVSQTNHIWTNVKVVPSKDDDDVTMSLDKLSKSLREVEMIKILKRNRISVTIGDEEHNLSRDLTDLIL